MNVVFDENGDFKVGSVISEGGGALQVETHTGKRVKVKAGHVLQEFRTPEPSAMLSQAQALVAQIDLDLIWECAPADEFGFEELAISYFGDQPSSPEVFALLLAIHGAPIYFYRKGRGRYRAASADTLKAALAAVEKRKQQQIQINDWAQSLIEGQCPPEIRNLAAQLLVAPDKNGPHFKALQQACDSEHLSAQRLLMKVGAFKSAFDLHYKQFVLQAFPKGVGFKSSDTAETSSPMPVSPARCFSIDDSSTTEIDDCLSVQILDPQRPHLVRVGVHIAAPTSTIEYDSALDVIARERMSTLYMPGDKITMLPDAVIEKFSLDQGRQVCAASLYLDFDLSQKVMLESSFYSCLENIHVAANLRHDKIEHLMTEELLESVDQLAPTLSDDQESAAALGFTFLNELKILWSVTQILSAERDKVRGKPEARNRADFNFKVDHATGQVEIIERQRNSPLDRIVAEMMILANNQWGKFLAGNLTPAIYRSQQMGRVKMTTYPQPHQGLGVTHYGWFTSPLRRYSDMVNQRQLLAVLQKQAPVFAQNDARLHAAIAAFDARYASYNEFQSRMEKYWCLRWVAQSIAQSNVASFPAVVVKPGLIRFKQIPLYTLLTVGAEIATGQAIEVEVLALDEIDLEVQLRFVKALDSHEDAIEASDEEFESALDPADQSTVEGTHDQSGAPTEAPTQAPIA